MDSETLIHPACAMLPIVREDLEKIKDLQPFDWPDITLAYMNYIESWFCQPMKLIQGEKLIGIGCVINFRDTAWLAQIIVNEIYRNHGWGSYLTKYLIHMIDQQARSISLLATPMGEPVYKKLGFVPVSTYVFFRRNGLYNKLGDAKNIVPYHEEYLTKLLELDLEVMGEDRSRLLLMHLEQALIIKEGTQLLAYYLPTLGEGLIVSKKEEAGLDLLKLKMSGQRRNVVPNLNKIVVQFLTDEGYEPYREARRMILGQPINHLPQMIYSRIGGNLG